MAVLWILWCVLTIVHISDSQRRALVNYSYTPAKPPSQPYNLTALPVSGDATSVESSQNYISNSATASIFLRGSSRGELPIKLHPTRKDSKQHNSGVAKGDFAARDRVTQGGNATVQDQPVTSLPQDVRNSADDKKAAISGGALADDGIHLRRVSSTSLKADDNSPNNDDPLEKNDDLRGIEPKTPDIAPTQVDEKSVRSSNRDPSSRDEKRTPSREYSERSHPPRRDDEIQSSRHFDANHEFNKESPLSSDRGITRYDDERGSRSRYDKRDRGRDTDDRYSKGDTRMYSNDEVRSSIPSEHRYRDKIPPLKADGDRPSITSEDRDRMPPLKTDNERSSRTSDDRYRDRIPPLKSDDEKSLRTSEDRYIDRMPPLKDDDEIPSRTTEDRDRIPPLKSEDQKASRTSEDRYRDRMPPLKDDDERPSRTTEDRDRIPPLKSEDQKSSRTSEDRYRDPMPPLKDDTERSSRTTVDRDRIPLLKSEDHKSSRTSEDRYRDRMPPLKDDDERPSRTTEDRDRIPPLKGDDERSSRTSDRDTIPPSDYDRYTRYPDDSRPRSDYEKHRIRGYEDIYRARDDRPRYREDNPEYRARADRPRYREDDPEYRARDDTPRYREGDSGYRARVDRPRYREDNPEYKARIDEDRYSDGDRYRSRDERYRARDPDRYRPKDDDRYRDRTAGEKLPDRILEDLSRDRYRSRDYEDRYKDDSRPNDRDGPVGEKLPDRLSEESDRNRYRPRSDDNRYRDDIRPRYRDPTISRRSDDLSPPERSPLSERQYSSIGDTRGDVLDTRSEKPFKYVPSEDRYRDSDDKYKRPSRDRITPTRVEDESYVSGSTSVDSRPRDVAHTSRSTLLDDRHIDNDRSRVRYTKYYDGGEADNSREMAPSSVESSKSISYNKDDYRTRLPDAKYVDRGDEVVLDRRSYTSKEDDDYRRISRTRSYDYDDRYSKVPSDDPTRDYRDEYSRRSRTDDDEYRPKGDYDVDRTRYRGSYDDEYRRYKNREDRSDRSYDDRLRRGDDIGLWKDIPAVRDSLAKDGPIYDDRSDQDRSRTRDDIGYRKEVSTTIDLPEDDRIRLETIDDLPPRPSGDTREDRRYIDDSPPRYLDVALIESPPKSTNHRDPIIESSMSSSDTVILEKRFQSARDKSQSINNTSSGITVEDRTAASSIRSGESQAAGRPLNARDVIEAALRQSDQKDQGSVFYPVFDPRVSNLTSPDVIRPSERRGTTINARKRRMTM